jgi:hypothetical protein
VSLILDALRKLEREKGAHEPGVLVVGSVPWGERSRARRFLLGAGAVLALALAALAGWLMRRDAPSPAVARPEAAAPTPVVAATVAPIPLPPTPSPVTTAEEEPTPAPPIRLSKPPVVERPLAPAEHGSAVEAPKSEAGAPSPSAAAPAAPTTPTTGPHELRLSAISQRDGKPVALINDRLVFEGDSFDGVRVIRIGESEVEVEVKGQRQLLRF